MASFFIYLGPFSASASASAAGLWIVGLWVWDTVSMFLSVFLFETKTPDLDQQMTDDASIALVVVRICNSVF